MQLQDSVNHASYSQARAHTLNRCPTAVACHPAVWTTDAVGIDDIFVALSHVVDTALTLHSAKARERKFEVGTLAVDEWAVTFRTARRGLHGRCVNVRGASRHLHTTPAKCTWTRADSASVGHELWVRLVNIYGWVTWVTN